MSGKRSKRFHREAKTQALQTQTGQQASKNRPIWELFHFESIRGSSYLECSGGWR